MKQRDTTYGIHLYKDQVLIMDHALLLAPVGYGLSYSLNMCINWIANHYSQKELELYLFDGLDVGDFEAFKDDGRVNVLSSLDYSSLNQNLSMRVDYLGREQTYTGHRLNEPDTYLPRYLVLMYEHDISVEWFQRNHHESALCGIHFLFATTNSKFGAQTPLRKLIPMHLQFKEPRILSGHIQSLDFN
jgi:hypothetical protein